MTPSRQVVRIGGSFAPTLTTEKVAKYRELATQASPEVAEVMVKLCDMVEHFNITPASTQASTPHPIGAFRDRNGKHRSPMITPLSQEEIQRIDEKVPWNHEIEMYKLLFDSIPNDSQKEIRDAAHHLLWYAVELEMDREPITMD